MFSIFETHLNYNFWNTHRNICNLTTVWTKLSFKINSEEVTEFNWKAGPKRNKYQVFDEFLKTSNVF